MTSPCFAIPLPSQTLTYLTESIAEWEADTGQSATQNFTS